jgi:hypothetical protein
MSRDRLHSLDRVADVMDDPKFMPIRHGSNGLGQLS